MSWTSLAIEQLIGVGERGCRSAGRGDPRPVAAIDLTYQREYPAGTGRCVGSAAALPVTPPPAEVELPLLELGRPPGVSADVCACLLVADRTVEVRAAAAAPARWLGRADLGLKGDDATDTAYRADVWGGSPGAPSLPA